LSETKKEAEVVNEELPKTDEWACAKCGAGLVSKNKIFSYMGMTFSHEVPRCPVCGMVFISKELADGKMAKVEQLMEDK
jgi:rubrerythrin